MPVVRVPYKYKPLVGRERFHHERSRPDGVGRVAAVEVSPATFRGDHRRVVIEDEHQIGVGAVKRELNRQVIDLLDAFGLQHVKLGCRRSSGVWVQPVLEIPDHVIGAKGLAIVERHPLLEVNRPHSRVFVGLP